jgi:hypothetical protein
VATADILKYTMATGSILLHTANFTVVTNLLIQISIQKVLRTYSVAPWHGLGSAFGLGISVSLALLGVASRYACKIEFVANAIAMTFLDFDLSVA